METKSLTILINESVMLMRGVGYSEKSILRFKQIWDSKLNNFMSVKGFEHYSTSPSLVSKKVCKLDIILIFALSNKKQQEYGTYTRTNFGNYFEIHK